MTAAESSSRAWISGFTVLASVLAFGAEDGGEEEYEDEHDRRDADDQLAAPERVRSVDDDRRVAG